MVVQELGVAVAELLDKLRRAFDVCEEEGDGSMGKLRHRSLLQRDLSTNAGSGARWTFDLEPAAQRGHPVGQPSQTGAAPRISAADAVVGHLDECGSVRLADRHLHR